VIYKDNVIGGRILEHIAGDFLPEETSNARSRNWRRRLGNCAGKRAIVRGIARQNAVWNGIWRWARELQVAAFAADPAEAAHLDVAAKFVPARAIGGDLYDFDSLFTFTDGDCSGRRQREGRAGGYLCGAGKWHLAFHAPI